MNCAHAIFEYKFQSWKMKMVRTTPIKSYKMIIAYLYETRGENTLDSFAMCFR